MRKLIVLFLTFLLIISSPVAFSATPKVGGSCTKINQFHDLKSTLLVCATTKGKKTWRKATSVEKSLYQKENIRLAKAAAKKIIDDAKAEAARILIEVNAAAELKAKQEAEAKAAELKAKQEAEAKAAAELKAKQEAEAKAAAELKAKQEAEAKAAAELKAKQDAAAKAAADAAAKAAADAAAKAAADAAAKAAADAAAKAAADAPNLIAGRFFSGQDADNPSWKWVAVEISNSSPYNILSHRSYDVLIGDAGGAIVDSSWEPGFPLLIPSQRAWYVTTQFNTTSSSQVVFRKTYSTQPSPLSASEFPAALNPRLISSPYNSSRKAVSFTLKNNSGSRIIGSSSKAFAVIFNAAGVPVYAKNGFIGKSVLPGGQAEITFGDFTFNGEYSSIQVTIGVNLD
jgi:hypothetical protein